MTDNSVKLDRPDLPSQTVSFSGRYLAMVGGLLVLIIAMLAVLWVKERGRRADAETTVAQLRKENARWQLLFSMMDKSGPGLGAGPATREGPGEAIQPFQRQDQVPVTVTLDGVSRDAFRLHADGAARFGFREGDVILVVGRPGASTPTPTTTAPGR